MRSTVSRCEQKSLLKHLNSVEAELLEQDTITQLSNLDTSDGLVLSNYSKRESVLEKILRDDDVEIYKNR